MKAWQKSAPNGRLAVANRLAWEVSWTENALEDLNGILDYIEEREGLEIADDLHELIDEEVKEKLSFLPLRGKPIAELPKPHEFREIVVKKGFRAVYLPDETELKVWVLYFGRTKRPANAILENRTSPSPSGKE